ncbi:MAG: cysteine--tRNA ligase [Candidatus Paceibacterota bacterium]|jgi:cysteinyl-tRNA synthetase
MALNLLNSLGRSKQPFEPLNPPVVSLYTCGPTVYNRAHIGNLRAYIFADLLFRTLKYKGLKPNWVMNITDVDDKTIKGTVDKFGSEANNEHLEEYTRKFAVSFDVDLWSLNISTKEIKFKKVTEAIPEIQKFIIELIDKGFAYQADDGSTYFSIEKYQQAFGDYGSLMGNKFIEGKKNGARVKVDEYDKDNLSDFVLWKNHTVEDGNIGWAHERLGFGRPGWHIECSAINRVFFGDETIDIHTGGVDLAFPHHTNEMAQSKALTGQDFVKYWLHSEHVLVDGKKMSKSLGNVYIYEDFALKAINPISYRYFVLQSSYNQTINFTWEALAGSETAWLKLISQARDWKNNSNNLAGIIDKNYRQKFDEALDRDLNSPQALATVWELAKDEEISPADKLATLLDFDQVLGLKIAEHLIVEKIPEDIELLAQEREKARLAKDWSLADQIRDQIADLGYEVLDTDNGVALRKKGRI